MYNFCHIAKYSSRHKKTYAHAKEIFSLFYTIINMIKLNTSILKQGKMNDKHCRDIKGVSRMSSKFSGFQPIGMGVR